MKPLRTSQPFFINGNGFWKDGPIYEHSVKLCVYDKRQSPTAAMLNQWSFQLPIGTLLNKSNITNNPFSPFVYPNCKYSNWERCSKLTTLNDASSKAPWNHVLCSKQIQYTESKFKPARNCAIWCNTIRTLHNITIYYYISQQTSTTDGQHDCFTGNHEFHGLAAVFCRSFCCTGIAGDTKGIEKNCMFATLLSA